MCLRADRTEGSKPATVQVWALTGPPFLTRGTHFRLPAAKGTLLQHYPPGSCQRAFRGGNPEKDISGYEGLWLNRAAAGEDPRAPRRAPPDPGGTPGGTPLS